MAWTNLQEAFREAARREFAAVPPENELHYTFSRKFERKMNRIIRAQAHGYWQLVNTTAKRAACVAAIVLMLLTSVMAIKPVRERVIKFFVEVYEEYFAVTFGVKESEDLLPSYEPMTRYTFSWMPEGYTLVNHIPSDSRLWTDWQNGSKKRIILEQEPGARRIILDNKSIEAISILHNDLELSYYCYTDTNCFIWEQYGYIFHLTIYEDLSKEQMLNIIDSLVPVSE